jgi:hypothetical protein
LSTGVNSAQAERTRNIKKNDSESEKGFAVSSAERFRGFSALVFGNTFNLSPKYLLTHEQV